MDSVDPTFDLMATMALRNGFTPKQIHVGLEDDGLYTLAILHKGQEAFSIYGRPDDDRFVILGSEQHLPPPRRSGSSFFLRSMIRGAVLFNVFLAGFGLVTGDVEDLILAGISLSVWRLIWIFDGWLNRKRRALQ